MAPELAYVTARYAALAPFGKVADLLSELLPISGARNAGTVRNRMLRVGEDIVQPHPTKMARPTTSQPAEPVVVGLDGGYVRSRHRQEECHFEFTFRFNRRFYPFNAFRSLLGIGGQMNSPT